MEGTCVCMYLSVLVSEFFRHLNGFVTIKCACLSVGLSICLCDVYRVFGTHLLVFV